MFDVACNWEFGCRNASIPASKCTDKLLRIYEGKAFITGFIMRSRCDAVQRKDQHLGGTAGEWVREWVGERSLRWTWSITISDWRLAKLHNLSFGWFCRMRQSGATIKPLHVHPSLIIVNDEKALCSSLRMDAQHECHLCFSSHTVWPHQTRNDQMVEERQASLQILMEAVIGGVMEEVEGVCKLSIVAKLLFC